MKLVIALNILLIMAYSEAVGLSPTNMIGILKHASKILDGDGVIRPKSGMVPAELIMNVLPLSVDESEVKFWYHSRNTPDAGVEVNTTMVDVLRFTDFNPYKKTTFLIHGWNNTRDSEFLTTVLKAMVDSSDELNIFVVDWSAIAARDYLTSAMNVLRIGKFTANFIQALVTTRGLSLSDVTLVGHSLGSHVAGCTGSSLNGEISTIVGLDAAQPLIMLLNPATRLDKTDAKFVQAIHSNGGYLGYLYSIGHADYYPNGGSLQPECSDPMCAHNRCFYYYAESLTSDGFVGRSCSSYAEYVRGNCDSNPASVMGTYNIDTSAYGDYFLETNSEAPFARG